MRLGEQLAEIFVTARILHQHRQHAPVFHRQFRADNGTHTVFARGDGKSLRAVDAVAIEQRHRRHVQRGGGLSQLLGKRSAAKETEGAAGVEFDVRHTRGP
jgi:hypothetical protein